MAALRGGFSVPGRQLGMIPGMYEINGAQLYQGDCAVILPGLAAESVQMCLTSPPYFGMRSYGGEGEIGTESTPAAYVAALVSVFRQVRRLLRPDGTLWLNLGDTMAGAGYANHRGTGGATRTQGGRQKHLRVAGLPNKNMLGIPWRVAFALQADGWILRSAITWHKLGAQPDPAVDRPSKAHDLIFLFAKQRQYYFGQLPPGCESDVWSIPVRAQSGHRATYPAGVAVPCIEAGSRPGDTVLDPFAGLGTSLLVARQLGRRAVGIELVMDYVEKTLTRLAA